jgi:Rnl2 family RNA ligase
VSGRALLSSFLLFFFAFSQKTRDKMTAPFQPYEKMALSSARWPSFKSSRRFVVTEKVHGAHFVLVVSVAADGSVRNLRYAKRGGLLDDGDDFFGFRTARIPQRYGGAAHAVARAVAQAGQGALMVQVHGELFGGGHPAMPALAGRRLVQSGIAYSDDIEFMAFDVSIAAGCDEEGGVAVAAAGGAAAPQKRRYLSFEAARAVCAGAGMPFAQPLFVGSQAQAVDFPFSFESTIPALLGKPAAGPANLAEGVVIKALLEEEGGGEEVVQEAARRGAEGQHNGSRARLVLKQKIEQFNERRYDIGKQGRAAATSAAGGMGTVVLRCELAALLTPARLASVLSKTGLVDWAQPVQCRAVLRAFVKDAVDDLRLDNAEAFAQLQALGDAQASLMAEVRGEAKLVIQQHAAAQCGK